MRIQSHKTAIRRYELSRPLKLAIQDSVLNEDDTIFDYGCGRGDDLEILQSMNYQCSGWDPAHKPDADKVIIIRKNRKLWYIFLPYKHFDLKKRHKQVDNKLAMV